MSTLIVGASTGIGLEIVKNLAAKGTKVIATCRANNDNLKSIKGVKIIENVDVAKCETLKHLSAELKGTVLDTVIVVSGVLDGHTDQIPLKNEQLTDNCDFFKNISNSFEVNAVGHLKTYCAIHDLLNNKAKVAFITSRMGSVDDNGSGGLYAYRASKCALHMLISSLKQEKAAVENETVFSLIHPGFVRTRMTGNKGSCDPDESADKIIKRVAENSASGAFIHAITGEILPW